MIVLVKLLLKKIQKIEKNSPSLSKPMKPKNPLTVEEILSLEKIIEKLKM